MNHSKSNKKNLIEQIQGMERRVSTTTVLFHQAMAEKAGLSGSDHKYLDLLFQHGSLTAGKMAELTGLTTGAVTGLIDRLEKEGLVKREYDPNDRRKVLVVLQKDKALQRLGRPFQELKTGLETLYSAFTMTELLTIQKYLQVTLDYFEEKIQALQPD